MTKTFEASPPIAELELEPLLSKGELVLDQWWERPAPNRVSFLRAHWLFIVTFCAPVALAVLYLGVVASDQYVSEARFTVRTSSAFGSANLASLLEDQKMSRATDETFVVSEYLTSRDAMQALLAKGHLRDVLSRPDADFFSRFPNIYSRDNNEQLYRHFLRFVDTEVDSESGISTLRVRAFTPQDSQALATALLQGAEELVNQINARANGDTLRLANRFVDEAKAKLADVESRLTLYRNAQKVVDPNKESAAALAGMGAMMTRLMQTEASLAQQIAMAPASPQIGPLREQVTSLRDEIAKQRGQIAGDSASMADKLSDFDQLMLDRELAARELEAAESQMTTAREDVERQQFYLQRIVEPNLADQAQYPRRLLGILVVAGISLCVFQIVRTMVRNIWEHQA